MTNVILFDFWGTLVETGVWSPTKQVRNILHIEIPFHEFVVRFEKAMMTKNIPTLKDGFDEVFKEFNVEPHQRKMDDLIGMWNKSWMLARPYPELQEVLEELSQKYTLVLFSNTDPFSVKNVLEKYNLRKYFKHIFLSCEMGKIKTEEGFIGHILDQIKSDATKAVLVGDSIESDMVTAQRANVRSILVDRSQNREYTAKIASLKDLAATLEE
ncbi:HAD family hydrolase [Candidatus Woesearchaeota archaeon]|nr:HAD family hydrolase [Candidatus Woesearchaeota archaeon]